MMKVVGAKALLAALVLAAVAASTANGSKSDPIQVCVTLEGPAEARSHRSWRGSDLQRYPQSRRRACAWCIAGEDLPAKRTRMDVEISFKAEREALSVVRSQVRDACWVCLGRFASRSQIK